MKSRLAVLDFILSGITFLLVLLWSYTALSKLADLAEFKRQLEAQHLGHTFTSILFWFIPAIELLAAFSLLFTKTRFFGLWLSLLLMIIFTVYIALTWLGYFDQMPCSCGGVLKELGWQAHFWFNLFFLSASAVGIMIQQRSSHGPR